MPKRSPGPEWAVLHESTSSSHEDSVDELEPETQEDELISSSLKRKGSSAFAATTSKRAKFSPQQNGQENDGSTSSNEQGLNTDFNSHTSFGGNKSAHLTSFTDTYNRRLPTNHNGVAGPSKLSTSQATQPRGSTTSKPFRDVEGVIPAKKTSLPNLNVRKFSGSISQNKASFVSPKAQGYNGDSYDSSSSPATPPPETPMFPPKVPEKFKDKPQPSSLSNLFQERMRRPHSLSNLKDASPTQRVKYKPKLRASLPNTNDVIEISSETDTDAPPKLKSKRPLHRPTTPVPTAAPVSAEAIEISSEDEPPSSRNKGKLKEKGRSERTSKAPIGKPSRMGDGPPSTLRINAGKSGRKSERNPFRSSQRRMDGVMADPEVIVIDDSDDDSKAQGKAEVMPGASTSGSASGRSSVSASASARSATTSFVSTSTSRQDSRPQDTEKTARCVTDKSSDTSRHTVPVASTSSGVNSFAADGNAKEKARSRATTFGGQTSSAGTSSSNTKVGVPSMKSKAESRPSISSNASNKDQVPGGNVKVGSGLAVAQSQSQPRPELPSQAVVSSRKEAGLPISVQICRGSQAPAPVQAKTTNNPTKVVEKAAVPSSIAAKVVEKVTIPSNVAAKAAASAQDDDAMDVDHHITNNGVSSPDAAAVKVLDAKVDDNSRTQPSAGSFTQTDKATAIHSSVAQMQTQAPVAAVSDGPTPYALSGASLAKSKSSSMRRSSPMSTDALQVFSSSGLMSASPPATWKSSIWTPTEDKDAPSSQQASGKTQQGKASGVRPVRQSSGMDMRTLKEVLTKEVDSEDNDPRLSLASQPGPGAVVPTPSMDASLASAAAQKSAPIPTSAPVTPTAGPPNPSPSVESKHEVVPASASNVIAVPPPIPSTITLQRSTPANVTATTSHPPSTSSPASHSLPRKASNAAAAPVSDLGASSSSVSEVQPQAQSPTQRLLSQPTPFTKRIPSATSVPMPNPKETQTQGLAPSTSSYRMTTPASSSQPRKSPADAITQASQSNMRTSPKKNRFPKHDAIPSHDNDDSDVEIARPTSLDRSTYEDAVASAEVLRSLIQPVMAAGSSSPTPHSRLSSTEEARNPTSTPRSSEPRSIVGTPPLPRRSFASPKKPVSVEGRPIFGVSTVVSDVHGRVGTPAPTPTDEGVAVTASTKPSDGAQAQQQKQISTSESVAQAISSKQPPALSSQLSGNIRANDDSQKNVSHDGSLAHIISSSQSPASPASLRRSQTQPDARAVPPLSTSENVARAISSDISLDGQARSRLPSSTGKGATPDNVPPLPTRTQSDGPVPFRPNKALPGQTNSKLPTSTAGSPPVRYLPVAPSPESSLFLHNHGGSVPVSSAHPQQKTPLPSPPSTSPFPERTIATDQPPDKPTPQANVPLIRSFVSSTLILTPAQHSSENGSSKGAINVPRAPAPPVSENLSSISARAAHPPATERPHLPHKEASESIAPSSLSSAMNVDQVTDDIALTVVALVEEHDSDSEVENLLAPSTSPSPTPPIENSAAPDVPVTIPPPSTPPEIPHAQVDAGADDATRRRSSRLSSRSSSRSSSHDPMDVIPDDDDGEYPTSAESLPPSHSPTPDGESGPISIKTYGGFPSLNWKTFRQNINNFTPKCYYSRDLPHTLQDYINQWPESARLHPQMRHVLQSSIQENTADDEPDAPYIEIINIVDHEPTPPWEFHYSNKMWHTDGVPPPDVTKLTSCECMGKCDPKSKTCACIKRQQQYVEGIYSDFAYDKNGRLKFPDYPVFECNDLCGCDDECRNRVVQHGRKAAVNICKTKDKGWGVFAGAKKICNGTFIGIYAGELLTDEVGEARGKKYNAFGRTYLFDLDFHHLRQGEDENGWEVKYVIDAYHAGNFTRFLNHSCDPNCQLVPCYINESDIDKPLLAVFARRDIEVGEEICFSYNGDNPDDDDQDPSSPPQNDNEKKSDEVYARCRCGAATCTGKVFA